MTSRRTAPPGFKRNRSLRAAVMAFGSLAVVCAAPAQTAAPEAGLPPSQFTGGATQAEPVMLAEAPAVVGSFSSSLPEAPVPQSRRRGTPSSTSGPSTSGPSTSGQAAPVASLYDVNIPSGWKAQPLTARDKVVLGARQLYSFENVASIAIVAGYTHIVDGQPNYGVNSKAFAQRLGAAAVRESSQTVFAEMIMAPLLHEDPRYYVKGPGTGFLKRSVYAATRPLITRTDAGNSTVNAALLIGYAGSAALTPAFYPPINRNFQDVAATFGGSIGGAALGYFVIEFTDDALTALRLKRSHSH